MTELPDDMEALVERVALPWLEAEEMSVDPEELAKAGQAVRALLLAYQERGRALEFVRDEARRGQSVRPGDAYLVLIDERADATLNQKGKSHD